MNNWTEKHMKGLLFQRKIKSFHIDKRESTVLPAEVKNKPSKAMSWLKWNLQYWCNERALSLVFEFQFCKDRKYRSDFAIAAHKILIEYEGGIFMERGGHNSPTGIQRDIDKYQLAQKLGYRVIRLTAKNYTSVLQTLNEMI